MSALLKPNCTKNKSFFYNFFAVHAMVIIVALLQLSNIKAFLDATRSFMIKVDMSTGD